MEKVEPEPNSGCWLWMGSLNAQGYGSFSWERSVRGAHRYAVTVQARQTHCVHGHEFTPKNTYTDPRGHRACKACRRRIDHARGKYGERASDKRRLGNGA